MNAGTRARLEANSFEVLIALLCLVTVAGFFVAPEIPGRTPVGRLLGLWGWVWVAFMLLSAVLILAGLWRGRANWEVAGLIFLVTAIAVQVVALWRVVGITSITSIATFVAVGWAAFARAARIASDV